MMCIYSIPSTIEEIKLANRWISVDGIVESITSKTDSCRKHKNSYYDCIKFSAHVRFHSTSDPKIKNRQLSVSAGSAPISQSGSAEPTIHTGAIIPMVYDPKNPEDIRKDAFIDRWQYGTLLTVTIIVLVLLFRFFR